MNTTGIAHIAICVNDLEKSLAFYRDIHGMTVKRHATQAMARRPGAGSSAMCPAGTSASLTGIAVRRATRHQR